MISERLSNLSCNEDEFIKTLDEYQNVLKNSGYKDKLFYTPCNQRNRRQRNRKIIWYNPPFDLQVKTNTGKNFFQLLHRNFPPHHRLHKIINRNTVKISYCVYLTWHHTFLLIIKTLHKNLRNHNSQIPKRVITKQQKIAPLKAICCYLSSRCNSRNR